jgi:hypothetical protein
MSGNFHEQGGHVSAAVHEHSLESGAADNSHKIKPESGILHDTVASVPQERFERCGVGALMSSREIMAALSLARRISVS